MNNDFCPQGEDGEHYFAPQYNINSVNNHIPINQKCMLCGLEAELERETVIKSEIARAKYLNQAREDAYERGVEYVDVDSDNICYDPFDGLCARCDDGITKTVRTVDTRDLCGPCQMSAPIHGG